ncbi:hypothetical protein BOTBODRAFT_603186 [Botryobasidium botryosum FD-172 SS1]|uniref:Uncharacterized protein n=1 Tax=Botryobasidium botryosum (strain FD-172 SS1) TaxID=930990 RepID=A0A067MNL8_BOTB1|nr:hypothetical protein BOTBODRAFT_603186 [Botryobasidium botryosum FD-172 SS1]
MRPGFGACCHHHNSFSHTFQQAGIRSLLSYSQLCDTSHCSSVFSSIESWRPPPSRYCPSLRCRVDVVRVLSITSRSLITATALQVLPPTTPDLSCSGAYMILKHMRAIGINSLFHSAPRRWRYLEGAFIPQHQRIKTIRKLIRYQTCEYTRINIYQAHHRHHHSSKRKSSKSPSKIPDSRFQSIAYF